MLKVASLDEEGRCCPCCHLPFDKGKRRRLLEACGHQRCYACVFASDACLVCSNGADKAKGCVVETGGKVSRTTSSGLKTNGHFTLFMRSRNAADGAKPISRQGSALGLNGVQSPPLSRPSWTRRRQQQQRPSTVSVENHSTLSELAKIHQWPMNMVRKIRSLWAVGK